MDTNVQKAVEILRAGVSIGDESVRITQVILTEEHGDIKFSIYRQRRREDGEWIDDENPFCFTSDLLLSFEISELEAAAREVFGPNTGVVSVSDNKRLSR